MKISQTWLASQTGVSERWISARGRSPLSASPATRSQKPAAEVGAAEDRVERRPDPEDHRGGVGLAHAATSGVAFVAACGDKSADVGP